MLADLAELGSGRKALLKDMILVWWIYISPMKLFPLPPINVYHWATSESCVCGSFPNVWGCRRYCSFLFAISAVTLACSYAEISIFVKLCSLSAKRVSLGNVCVVFFKIKSPFLVQKVNVKIQCLKQCCFCFLSMWTMLKPFHWKKECIPVGCVPPAAVAICFCGEGGVCLSACWDTPPGVGLESPTPGCGPGDPLSETPQPPPQVWAWRPPVDRMTDTCKNITFANFVCGR